MGINVTALAPTATVRALIPTMYGAARAGIPASRVIQGLRDAGVPAGRTQVFYRVYNAVRSNVAASQALADAPLTTQPAFDSDALIPTQHMTVHTYQLVVRLHGEGGASRVLTVGYDDPTLSLDDLMNEAMEIGNNEGYTAPNGEMPAGGWTSATVVEARESG